LGVEKKERKKSGIQTGKKRYVLTEKSSVKGARSGKLEPKIGGKVRGMPRNAG